MNQNQKSQNCISCGSNKKELTSEYNNERNNIPKQNMNQEDFISKITNDELNQYTRAQLYQVVKTANNGKPTRPYQESTKQTLLNEIINNNKNYHSVVENLAPAFQQANAQRNAEIQKNRQYRIDHADEIKAQIKQRRQYYKARELELKKRRAIQYAKAVEKRRATIQAKKAALEAQRTAALVSKRDNRPGLREYLGNPYAESDFLNLRRDILENDFNKMHEELLRANINHAFSFEERDTAFNKTTVSYATTSNITPNSMDVEIFLNIMKAAIRRFLQEVLEVNDTIKYEIKLKLIFIDQGEIVDILDNGTVIHQEVPVHIGSLLKMLHPGNIDATIELAYTEIMQNLSNYPHKKSGLVYDYIKIMHINYSHWTPLQGSSYKPFPDQFMNTKSLINIKNFDNECFRWCVMRHDHPRIGHPNRVKDLVDQYKNNPAEYNWEGIQFPATIRDIKLFETLNKRTINMFTAKKTKSEGYLLTPLYLSNRDQTNPIDLFWFDDHYGLITDFNKLNFSITKHKEKKFFCKRCLHHYNTPESLKQHENVCRNFEYTRTILPTEKNKYLEFTKYERGMRVPFVIYADFECLTMPIYGPECDPKDKTRPATNRYQHHVPSQCGFYVVSNIPGVTFDPFIYTGPDANLVLLTELGRLKETLIGYINGMNEVIEANRYNPEDEVKCQIAFNEAVAKSKIMESDEAKQLLVQIKSGNRPAKTELNRLVMRSIPKEIRDNFEHIQRQKENSKKNIKNMIITPEEQTTFNQQVQSIKDNSKNKVMCHICNKQIKSATDIVRDHCHITGKFRGPAHNACNLKYTIPKFIPVFFHNLKNYDAHFILQAANSPGLGYKNITCIPTNMEKYISFSLDEYRFLDSFQFMSTSLEGLAGYLKDSTGGIDNFKHTLKFINKREQADLLTRKGVFPYDYMTSFDCFNDAVPGKDAFYSKLTQSHISDSDYKHVQNICKTFDIHNMRTYSELYLKTDVLILADVFEQFRDVTMDNFGLDPCHYYTAPGMSWEAMFKMTNAKVELITDQDMLMFFETPNSKRGGISMVANQYAKANNKYMGSDYDPSQKSSYIAYYDATALYSSCMQKHLPYGGYQWISQKAIDSFNLNIPKFCDLIKSMSDTDVKGSRFEVDLEYPEHLHEMHNDYPLAAENLTVTESMLSNYNRKLLKDNNLKHHEIGKLIPNLQNKTNYILDYRNLKLYLELGMRVTKIHSGMTFDQRPWMKPYIDFCMQQRKECGKNAFKKDYFKLLCNSVYGKTMEDVRNHISCKIVTTQKQKDKWINSPRCKTWTIWGESYMMIELAKNEVVLNKPVQVGCTVLDISKVHMYDFHYNHILKKYGNKAKLLFTDTDSLCYHLETEDLYDDMIRDRQYFDLSEFPVDNKCFKNLLDENIKKPGVFKLETSDKIVTEFCGLRAKMYSIKLHDNSEKKTLKGISKFVRDRQISHEDYKNTLFGGQNQKHEIRAIRSFKHDVYTLSQTKTSLSACNDKKFMMSDFRAYSYGHTDIKNLE